MTDAGVHSRKGKGGPSQPPPPPPPLEELLPPLGSKFHIFLQSYYEMMKGIQHVHVLCFKWIFCEAFCSKCSILFLADSLETL